MDALGYHENPPDLDTRIPGVFRMAPADSSPLPARTRTVIEWHWPHWDEIDPQTGAVIASGTAVERQHRPWVDREELHP